MELTAFVLSQLPPAPARVLEVGCGPEGGVSPTLVEVGYDVLGIDPRAPEGPLFEQIELQQLEEPAEFDAVVAARVLHHVHPLDAALDKLARLAPLLILDEFAWERIDGPAEEWYEAQHRALCAAGVDLASPRDLTEWREAHRGLHPSHVLRDELVLRYEERFFHEQPYLHRWLGGPATEQLEQGLIEARAIQPIGWLYVGVRR